MTILISVIIVFISVLIYIIWFSEDAKDAREDAKIIKEVEGTERDLEEEEYYYNWKDWKELGHIKGDESCFKCRKSYGPVFCEECKKGLVHTEESGNWYDEYNQCTPYQKCDNCDYFVDSI